MTKISKSFILFVASFFLTPLVMGMEVKVEEKAFFNQRFPSAIVPGKIVFQSNRDGAISEIWVLESGKITKIASGKNASKNIPKQLSSSLGGMLSGAFTDLEKPKWSPDGQNILCRSDKQLVILYPNGLVKEEIEPVKHPHLPIWDTDGLAIYFVAIDNSPQGGGSENIYRLNLLDKSEKRITNLAPLPGIRSVLSIAITPDGRKIAFVMAGEDEYGISIWTVNTADGSDLRMLVKYASDPAWSPDGTKLAYSSNYLTTGEKINKCQKIFILDLKTMRNIQVTQKGWEDRRPVFSPDGTKIAFESYRHREIAHGSEIFVINIDGTGEARLTPPQQNPKYPNDMFRGWSTDQYPDWHA